MKTKSLFALLFVVSFLSACVASPTAVVSPPPSSTPVTTESPIATPTESSGSYSPAETAAIQYVSSHYNIPADQIKVLKTEAVTWPNGCLGVVIPGVMCTDVVTEGYKITLEAKSQQFEIHTNLDGSNVVDAAQQQATLRFVVRNMDASIQLVNPNIPLGPTYNPAFNGFLPSGASVLGIAYVYTFTDQGSKVFTVDSNGTTKDLTFVQKPTYGLAVWNGGEGKQPMLAWGTEASGTDQSSSLMISNADGSNIQTLVNITASTDARVQIVAEFWSADGQSVYFSKEPVGLGGYITFSGASNLYKIDVTTKSITSIIPQVGTNMPQTCLDAISGDLRYIADSCTQGVITVRDLQNNSSVTIQPPAQVADFRLMGSARFSPDGSRVAFALAKGNPDSEQGWVAVGSSAGGDSSLVLTGEAGSYYTVVGWLDDQTLLVQLNNVNAPNGINQLFTVGADGTNPTKVADGYLLAIVDNR